MLKWFWIDMYVHKSVSKQKGILWRSRKEWWGVLQQLKILFAWVRENPLNKAEQE